MEPTNRSTDGYTLGQAHGLLQAMGRRGVTVDDLRRIVQMLEGDYIPSSILFETLLLALDGDILREEYDWDKPPVCEEAQWNADHRYWASIGLQLPGEEIVTVPWRRGLFKRGATLDLVRNNRETFLTVGNSHALVYIPGSYLGTAGEPTEGHGPYRIPTSTLQLCKLLADANGLTISDDLAQLLPDQPLKAGWHLLSSWYKGGGKLPGHVHRYRIADLSTTLISTLVIRLKYGRDLDRSKQQQPLWFNPSLDLLCAELFTLRTIWTGDETIGVGPAYNGDRLVLERLKPLGVDRFQNLLPPGDYAE